MSILLRRLALLFCCAMLLVTTTAAAQRAGKRIDLIVAGDYVVTMDERQPVIERGAVAIDKGEIVAVGPADQITASYRAARVLPGAGKVVMPGLVNGHTHLAMGLFRGLADDLTLDDWLQNHIFPAEGRFVNPEFVRVGVELACWEMIRGGTTTFVDMYFYPDVEASVIERCGLRGVIAPSTIDFPSPGFTGWDDSFASAVDFIERWKGKNPRIIPALGVHAPYTVSPAHLSQAKEAAQRLGVPISIHVAETQVEVDDILNRYGNRPVNHLHSLDFFAARTIAAHTVHPDAAEIGLLAEQGVGVIHNPSSNLKLASGVSPVPQLLAAGVHVGLGTDGAASNNDLDMWEEMNLAALLHKGVLKDPTTVPAQAVLTMATLGGAKAIGLDQQIGALTAGRRADLIQVRLNEARMAPLYNIVSSLVYAANSDDVDTVVVEGKLLMLNGRVLTLDINRIRADVARIAAQIKAEGKGAAAP
ncbi:MAG TPA: amidohydrolase family protein [Roseiflexaceae bacterium]|nr:amidohydrolase family protein [Roseiflexaceae bacterium]